MHLILSQFVLELVFIFYFVFIVNGWLAFYRLLPKAMFDNTVDSVKGGKSRGFLHNPRLEEIHEIFFIFLFCQMEIRVLTPPLGQGNSSKEGNGSPTEVFQPVGGQGKIGIPSSKEMRREEFHRNPLLEGFLFLPNVP